MLCHPGLVETLMDRSVDKEREGREGRLITFKLKLYKEKVQGGFFNWSALKMTKCQTLRKF